MLPLAPPEDDGAQLGMVIMSDPEGLAARAFMNPAVAGARREPRGMAHRRRSRAPTATRRRARSRACTAFWRAAARQDGRQLLDAAGIARCREEQSHGPDLVLTIPTRFGLGFMLPQDRPDARFGPSPNAFGHPGAGGSVGFADPDARLGFGYVMNRMGPHILLDPRAMALIDATYSRLHVRRAAATPR